MNKIIYSNEHKKIVKKLKQARNEIGYDQNKVATILGKTQSYVSKLESGQRRIETVLLKKLAEIYKKNITFFIDTD